MNISVIGTGYVGLVTGACLSDIGNDIICVDNDRDKIKMLENGKIPFYEPGLEEMIRRNQNQGRLIFTEYIDEAVKSTEICFIAVGTPQNKDGSANLNNVLSCVNEIANYIDGYKVIVVKSTVPVGTCDKIEKQMYDVVKSNKNDVTIDVVSNPEFLKQGSAVKDFMSPDRVVIGVDRMGKAVELMEDLYAPFTRTTKRLLVVDRCTSEMIKYASNAMLALRISFMNEMAGFCEATGADIEKVRYGLGSDKRIGPSFLYSGVGYGGSCFPKDIKALISTFKEYNCPSDIISAVEKVNERQKHWPLKILNNKWQGDYKGKKVAIWGLSYKPNTDDLRDAPSINVIRGLLERGVLVIAHDPAAMRNAEELFNSNMIRYVENPYDAVENADALLLLTEWSIFKAPDFNRIKKLLRIPLIIDGRNQYNSEAMTAMGFEYYGVGRGRKGIK